MYRFTRILILIIVVFLMPKGLLAQTKWVISNGSASNMPAGSLTSLAVAIERGAEAIKLDVVLSNDNQVVVLGDTILNQLTNAAKIFPERARPDGNLYAIDFSLDELKSLSHSSADGFDDRLEASFVMPRFGLRSLSEILDYLRLIEPSLESNLDLICEVKKSWFHRREDKDLSTAVYSLLTGFANVSAKINLYFASYDPEELQQLAQTKMTASSGEIGLIQLVGINDGSEVMTQEFGRYQPYNFDWLFTRFGLKAVSTYADSIGLQPQTVLADDGNPIRAGYLEDARMLGLKLFIYPAHADDYPVSATMGSLEASLEQLLFTTGFDGLLTSRDEDVRIWLAKRLANGEQNTQQQTIERLIEHIEESGVAPLTPLQSDTTR